MDYETHILLTAQTVDLPIPSQYLAGTVENFKRSAAMASHVMEFPLPTHIEPAPIYILVGEGHAAD